MNICPQRSLFGCILTILFTLAICTISSQAIAQQSSQTDVDIRTLKRTLIIRPDFETGTLDASSVLTISNESKESLKAISAILYHRLEVSAVRDGDGKDLQFTQRVVPMADFEKMLVKHIQISLDEPMSPGETLSLDIKYHGKLGGYTEIGRAYLKDHVSEEFTIIRLDCLAYPIACSPSMAAFVETAYLDLRLGWDYLLEVTVPENVVVASAGRLLGKALADGMVTYSYKNTKPAWRFDVCIGDYQILENDATSSRIFCFLEHKAQAQKVLNALEVSSELLSKWFGPLAEDEGLTVIEVPSGYGSQTSSTCIIQESEAFKGGQLHFFYHEVSHLWNPVPLDPQPSRFESEGLACFLEYLLPEKLDGQTGSLQKGLAQCRSKFRSQCRQNHKLKEIPISQYGIQDCTDASYSKGAIAFWVLYRLVGEQTFIDIYRSFRQEYADKGATLEDFVSTVKKCSGKNLQKYFAEWIYGAQSSQYLIDDLSLEQIVELYEEDIIVPD